MLQRHSELVSIKAKTVVLKHEIANQFLKSQVEPERIARQAESIEKAVVSMSSELKSLQKRMAGIDKVVDQQKERLAEAEKLRVTLDEQLELRRETIEQREQDISSIRLSFENEKAKSHDLLTRKVELNVKKKEVESKMRHNLDQLNTSKKEYDQLKRQYKKKRGIVDTAKAVLPTLANQLRDEELSYVTLCEEKTGHEKLLKVLKDDRETKYLQLMQQEGIEQTTKSVSLSKKVE